MNRRRNFFAAAIAAIVTFSALTAFVGRHHFRHRHWDHQEACCRDAHDGCGQYDRHDCHGWRDQEQGQQNQSQPNNTPRDTTQHN